MVPMRPTEYASGFLVFRRRPQLEFLLMKHPNRWDLPKGRLDFGETKREAAARELFEETGIPADAYWVDPGFEYSSQYWVKYTKQQEAKLKELSIYLCVLLREVDLVLTEHVGFEWFPWAPPHQIQPQTIDPLLAQTAAHIATWPPNVERNSFR